MGGGEYAEAEGFPPMVVVSQQQEVARRVERMLLEDAHRLSSEQLHNATMAQLLPVLEEGAGGRQARTRSSCLCFGHVPHFAATLLQARPPSSK